VGTETAISKASSAAGTKVSLLGREHGTANDLVRLDHDPRGLVLDEETRDAAGITRDGLLHLGAGD